jgi:hypothetical protein
MDARHYALVRAFSDNVSFWMIFHTRKYWRFALC